MLDALSQSQHQWHFELLIYRLEIHFQFTVIRF